MIYGSVCSGIEAASVAWEPLGWKPAFFSEIEKFPRAVLEHHWLEVPLHGDFTTIGENEYGAIDLLVGGTPCQSFSVAGLRKGLADDRGNLALEYLRLAQRKRPQWLVWENVPGVLSSNGGRDFGAFLGGLGELGYGFAYRVLDAQFFGVPQRRRRVFVVGYLGDSRPAAAVLFERHSLQGHPAPRRKKEQAVAGTITSGSGRRRGAGIAPEELTVAGTLTNDGKAAGSATLQHTEQGLLLPTCVTGPRTHALTAEGHDASEVGTGRGTPIVCHGTQDPCVSDKAFALGRNNGGENDIAFGGSANCKQTNVATALSAHPGGRYDAETETFVASASAVRRLTPVECERLQGFPDGHTQIPWRKKNPEDCPDGPRYKAIGNSMAVPVMHWIGKRIQQVNNL